MNINQIKHLLADASKTIENYNKSKKENEKSFNLLEISGISWLEVRMCRILAEIINPHGSHEQKSRFLKSFVSEVLEIDVPDNELQKATVVTEYPTDKQRRIDIVISTDNIFIPIEVKLFAKDQKNQCGEYYKFASSKSKQPIKVYYLTIDGHLPQETHGLTPVKKDGELVGFEEVSVLSFKTDICNWLGKIIDETNDIPKIIFGIEQFKNALENLGGNMDSELKRDIASVISENSINIKSALAISESIATAKENLLCKILEYFEKKIELLNLPLERLVNKFDYRYDNYSSVHQFYEKKNPYPTPALVYRYKKVTRITEIWFMVEFGAYGGLHCGFVTAKSGENPGKIIIPEKDLHTHINLPHGLKKDEWWFYWEYLPEHTGEDYYFDKYPDFKDGNDFFSDLFDKDNFDSYVSACMNRIEAILKEMIISDEEKKHNNGGKK